MIDKAIVAERLAAAHREIDPMISKVLRLVTDQETNPDEPVKLLEVNPATSPSGIVPILFGAHPPDVPFPSIVVEVTEEEYQRIVNGTLALPSGWSIGSTLYETAA